MPAAYRQLRLEDEAAVLDLWAAAFGEDREALSQAWQAADPAWLEHAQVAVAADGTLLGAASYTVRHLRDAAGQPRRVGQLGYLAIRASARRQGHGGRLLQQTLAALRGAGCAWAMVLPGPETTDFYAHHGWRQFSLLVCEGIPITDLPRPASPYAIRRYDPTVEPGGWAALAAVYAADSARRPLTHAREPDYWQRAIAPRVLGLQHWLRPPGTFLVAARRDAPGDLVGYVLVHWWSPDNGPSGNAAGHFEVSELCTRPGAEAATADLLMAVGQHATRQECPMGWGRLFVPREPLIEQAVTYLLRDPEWSTFLVLQAHAVAPGLDEHWLSALLAASSAVCWTLDVL